MKNASYAPQFMWSVLKHRRLTWTPVSGNRTKSEIMSFHSQYLELLIGEYWYLTTSTLANTFFFFSIPPFWKQAEKKERLVIKMNGAISRSLRELWKWKITISAVSGLFVKVAELNSISRSLEEKIKIYVRAKMCFEAFLLFTVYVANP